MPDPISRIPSHQSNFPERGVGQIVVHFLSSWWKQISSQEDSASEENILLLRRTQELQSTADEALSRLIESQEQLRSNMDDELFSHVETTVKRLSSRIKVMSNKLGPNSEQVEELDQLINDKVKPLVQLLSSKFAKREAIIQAVVEHAVKTVEHQIDGDLQVLSDDLNNILTNLEKVSEARNVEVQRLVQDALTHLSEILGEWKALKTPPPGLTLDNLDKWEDRIALLRTEYSHETMRIMDVIDKVIPQSSEHWISEETRQHLHEDFVKVASLEQDLPALRIEIEEVSPETEATTLQDLRNRLVAMSSEVTRLELDLNLAPELYTRLQGIREALDAALSHPNITPQK